MPDDPANRCAALQRELERQNEQWRQVEERLEELARLCIGLSPQVIDQIDEAFAPPARAPSSPFFHRLFR